MRTTNIRFTGLASGLDTETMVQSLVLPYKTKVDSATQQQKLLELKKDAWKEMNTRLLNFQTKVLDPMRLEGTFNKTQITVSNNNLINLDKNITLPEGSHTIKINSMATGATAYSKSIEVSNGKETALNELGISDNTDITINGKTVTVTAGMTIGELEEEMSEKLKEEGLNFKFDTNVNAFIVSSKETGAAQSIDLSGTDSDTLQRLGFVANDKDGSYIYTGKDAEVVYNGGIVVTSSTNNIDINGIKFSITGESQEIVTISATKDTESIVDFVKNFVDEYNTLIEDMHKFIDAPRNKDYLPLTAEQKKDMTDDEIKLWEDKINSSLLSNDPVLKELTSTMRDLLGQTVEGNAFSSLRDIGITTGNWKEKGKLHLDEEKLRKAINEDADAVVQLIAGQGDPQKLYEKENPNLKWADLSADEQQVYTEATADRRLGLGDRLYNTMNEKIKSTSLKSANSFYNDKVLQKQIDSEKKKVEQLEERMRRMEELYYAKFTAMEKALSQLNNQSSWLAGQLGGM